MVRGQLHSIEHFHDHDPESIKGYLQVYTITVCQRKVSIERVFRASSHTGSAEHGSDDDCGVVCPAIATKNVTEASAMRLAG
jgi:hypothetical protein